MAEGRCGVRIGAAGTLNFETPWIYTIAGATNVFDKGFEVQQEDSFTLFDYRVDIPLANKFNLSVGKQKEPISMERIMSMIQLPMQERTSISDALMPSRNTGAVLSGAALNQRMSRAGGLFNDFLESGKSFGNSSAQLVGRVTWLPYVSADDSNSVSAPALGDPTLGGYHITASWILTGEMREYRRRAGIFGPVPVAKTVYQGGWGAWELGLRYSDLDLTDGLIDGGEMDILSLGLS